MLKVRQNISHQIISQFIILEVVSGLFWVKSEATDMVMSDWCISMGQMWILR